MAMIDYDRVSAGFAQSRALPPEALDSWRRAIEPHVRRTPGMRILDVGAGTGVFAAPLARWFDALVVGVEPSAGMLREARRTYAHPRVSYISGEAEHLPLRAATCDVAWLSTVIHHIPDVPACARELRRVLRTEGVVLIRSSFPGRHAGIALFSRFFPGAGHIASGFPSIEQVVAAFSGAGFALQSVEAVEQVSAPSLRAYAERVRTRADTTLRLLNDEEFFAGLRALEREAAAETMPQPIVDRLDLLTLA